MRVLVVDDELGIREGCRRALAPQGFEVEVAENGPSGLRKLQEGVFDILLLDAMMPGMSGLEMLHHVRQLYPDLICIIITGYATVELAVQAMREGAHDFIAKPFTPGLLLEVMNRELDHQRLKREAQRVKNLEEEIRGLTRVKAEMEKLAAVESRFMLTMVHVLRAPVAVLQNSVQLIQKGYVPPEELLQVLERADLRAGELLATLDDILLLSRLKERLGTKPTEAVSLAEVLDSVRSSFQKEASERQLTISTEVADHPVLLGNPDHFRLLWSQLLSNAIRYTPNGGRITLSLKTNSHERQIQGTVSDTGIGIANRGDPADLRSILPHGGSQIHERNRYRPGVADCSTDSFPLWRHDRNRFNPRERKLHPFHSSPIHPPRRRSSLINWMTSLLGGRLRKVLIASFCLVAGLTVGLNALVTSRVIQEYLTSAESNLVARDMDLAKAFYQLKLDEVSAISHRLALDPWVIQNLNRLLQAFRRPSRSSTSRL